MHPNFLDLSKPIIKDVVAGKCTVARAKLLLKINSDIVINTRVRHRIFMWKALVHCRDIAFDSEGEKKQWAIM